jgi:GH15 family glucan-1,4-alpha-glucosidase
MSNLYQHSIEVILENQSPSGAYPACPKYPNYRYSWFRDGAFIAYSMNLVGEHHSAEKFHDWAATNVIKRTHLIERTINKVSQDKSLDSDDILHTRYSVNGDEAKEDWPNFQLDGFGTWLWSLGEHQRLTNIRLNGELLRAARLVADYISALWERPCFDCWEEFPTKIHPHSLAAIYAGLRSQSELSGTDNQQVLTDIRHYILDRAVTNGYFVKYIGSNFVDASLIGLAVPYKVFPPNDPIMRATVQEIDATLWNGGGVHRYPEDTFYGGGEWILLTAWLGWYYSQAGEMNKAVRMRQWVEDQADQLNELAEQVPATLIDASFYEPWKKRWGEIAKPLLWSHAMYIILYEELKNK